MTWCVDLFPSLLSEYSKIMDEFVWFVCFVCLCFFPNLRLHFALDSGSGSEILEGFFIMCEGISALAEVCSPRLLLIFHDKHLENEK